jgi:hypothetical protein
MDCQDSSPVACRRPESDSILADRAAAAARATAAFLGITLGCGKEQPEPPKGMNPFNKMEGKSPKEKAKPKNPMMIPTQGADAP